MYRLLSLFFLCCITNASKSKLSRAVPQEIFLIDKSTGISVQIIGCMHYNEQSIAAATSAVNTLGQSNQLGSLVIESCPTRWERTLRLQPKGSFRRKLFNNEMQAAQEACEEFKRPVILGDQDIETTNRRLKESLASSFSDLINPIVGWPKLYNDVRSSSLQTVFLPSSDSVIYLTANDFLDPKLLSASLSSFIRYPLAIFLKSPFATFAVLALLLILERYDYFGNASGNSPVTISDEIVDILESTFISFLELIVLSRSFLVALLLERNDVIVKNIRASCQILKDNGENDKVVIAVLGMAHSNGVAALLAR